MSDISVLSRSQVIVVDPATHAVAIINAGPPGAGGGGGGGGTGVTDGNKGDISVYDTGATWLINDGVVTIDKLDFVPALASDLATYAPINSPAFTGVPTTASTPAALDNSTKLATTEYIDRFPRIQTHDPIHYPVTLIGGVTIIDLSYAATGAGGSGSFSDATFDIHNDLDSSKKVTFYAGGVTGTKLYTFPDLDGTVALIDGSQVFTRPKLSEAYLGTGGGGAITLTAIRNPELYALQTITYNYASVNIVPVLQDARTHKYDENGLSPASYRFVNAQSTIQNVPGGGVTAFGGARVFLDSNIVRAATDAGMNVGAYISFRSSPIFDVTSTGTFTAGSFIGFQAAPNLGTGVTFSTVNLFSDSGTSVAGTLSTALNHHKMFNPTITGSVALQVGLEIEALTGATINIGIRNASSLRQVGQAVFGTDTVPTTGYSLEVNANPFGYSVGAGGVVAQATSKATGVTLNTASGQITTFNDALANGTQVSFTVTNSKVASTDTVIVNHISGGTLGSYIVQAHSIGSGSFKIYIRNSSGVGSLSEALVLQFNVIKGSIS